MAVPKRYGFGTLRQSKYSSSLYPCPCSPSHVVIFGSHVPQIHYCKHIPNMARIVVEIDNTVIDCCAVRHRANKMTYYYHFDNDSFETYLRVRRTSRTHPTKTKTTWLSKTHFGKSNQTAGTACTL
jgi:hypothetical protein